MPDVLAEFEALANGHAKQCVIARSASRLDVEDLAKLNAALDADHIGHRTISRWLKQHSLAGSGHAVRAHRNGECCCA